jgi:hypothetical protein
MRSQLFQGILIGLALLLIIALIGIGLANPRTADAPASEELESQYRMTALLVRLQSDITQGLEAMDDNQAYAAYDLGKTDLDGDAARGILANLSRTNGAIIDCTTIDANATILAAEPTAYGNVEGIYIGDQLPARHLLATKRPVLSDMMPVAEGIQAALLSAPIFDAKGRFIGMTSIVFKPDTFLAAIVEPAVRETPYSMTISQTDGLILYDTDPTQIGLMPDAEIYAEYPDLLALLRRIQAERYGTGRYTFTDGRTGEVTEKETFWTTAGIHGTEWRVALIRIVR